jgi:hypothetical protein
MSCFRWAIAQSGFDVGDAFAGFDGGGTGHGANDSLAAGPFARGRLGGHGHGSGWFAVILAQAGFDRVSISGVERRDLGMAGHRKSMRHGGISRPQVIDRALNGQGWQ